MSDPTDADRVKAKAALGELGEVTTAVESVAQALADERERVIDCLTCRECYRNETELQANLAVRP